MAQKLREFYWKCAAEKQAWEEYEALVQSMFVFHDPDNKLDHDAKEALEYGNAFKVRDAAKNGAKGKAMLKFLDKVNADKNIKAGFGKLHKRLIDTYGQDLTKKQKDLVLGGDAHEIAEALSKEAGFDAVAPIVVWTTKCTIVP